MGIGGRFACITDRHISHAQGSVLIRGLWLPVVGCQWHLLFRDTVDCSSPLLFWESFWPHGGVQRGARGRVVCERRIEFGAQL